MMERISRRTVLRGLGTVVALPALDAMLPRTLRAAEKVAAPRRMAFIYVPNGVHMDDWTPAREGARFTSVCSETVVPRPRKSSGRPSATVTDAIPLALTRLSRRLRIRA